MVRKRKDSTSSSSSEDDLISKQLKECVEGFEHQKKDVKKFEEKIILKIQKSKRPELNVKEEDDEENSHVTPEFQDFVGKKLKAKLDDLIEIVDVEIRKKKKKKKKDSKSDKNRVEDKVDSFSFIRGITCDSNVNDVNENDKVENDIHSNHKKHKKSKKQKKEIESSGDEDNEEMMKMLSEAAVQPNALLKASSINDHKKLINSEVSDKQNNKKSKKNKVP